MRDDIGNYIIEFRISKDAPDVSKDDVENTAGVILELLELLYGNGYVLYTLGEESCEEDVEE